MSPLEYAERYPNDTQPGPGSAPKEKLDTTPHGNVVARLRP